jgi:hypothetical protein
MVGSHSADLSRAVVVAVDADAARSRKSAARCRPRPSACVAEANPKTLAECRGRLADQDAAYAGWCLSGWCSRTGLAC